MNKIPQVELGFFFSVCPISGGLQPTLYDRNHWLFGKQLIMKNNIINVDTSFRHASYSAAFVSCKLLQFIIPKFYKILLHADVFFPVAV